MLAMSSAGHGQGFELSGGASSIYNAEGATLLIHGQSSETSIGGGFENRHFSMGGATERRLRHGSETVGLQTARADVPTDLFNETHLLVGVGAGTTLRGTGAGEREFRAFAGFSSTDGGSPLFRSGSLGRPAAFAQWTRKISENCRAVSTGIYLRSLLALETVDCLPGGNPIAHVALTLGGGTSGLYGAASYAFEGERLHLHGAYIYSAKDVDRGTLSSGPLPEPSRENVFAEYNITRFWSVSALHQNFTIPAFADGSQSTPREQTALDEGGVQYRHRGTSFSLTALQSSLRVFAAQASSLSSDTDQGSTGNRSYVASLEQNIGRLRWTESLVRSLPSHSTMETLSQSGLALRLNSHLLLSESVNVTDGRISLSHGGELLTPTASVRVDYELLYVANRPMAPMQQVAVVNANLRLWRSVAAEVASAIQPTGKVGYTFRLTSFHSRDASSAHADAGAHMGVNTLAGVVVDDRGAPVSGAAVLVGADRLYTDDNGCFSMRERHATAHVLRVLLDEFLNNSNFIVASAPETVLSGPEAQTRPIRIVLARKLAATVSASPAAGQPVAAFGVSTAGASTEPTS